ncbi:hypothetical protein BDZ45DRAFT_746754 [Acephala macrosclerotiorum]|nr:hypothetical protein BDZ45DRAFT_746754 [Acephala macrosclerotiorum]
MQFSKLTTIVALVIFSFVVASPIKPRDIASCETQTAVNEIACIQSCNKDTAYITSCSAVAVQG